jgi:hypothetical protein
MEFFPRLFCCESDKQQKDQTSRCYLDTLQTGYLRRTQFSPKKPGVDGEL